MLFLLRSLCCSRLEARDILLLKHLHVRAFQVGALRFIPVRGLCQVEAVVLELVLATVQDGQLHLLQQRENKHQEGDQHERLQEVDVSGDQWMRGLHKLLVADLVVAQGLRVVQVKRISRDVLGGSKHFVFLVKRRLNVPWLPDHHVTRPALFELPRRRVNRAKQQTAQNHDF